MIDYCRGLKNLNGILGAPYYHNGRIDPPNPILVMKAPILQHLPCILEVHGVISRVTLVITHITGLITPLITTHEPPRLSWVCALPPLLVDVQREANQTRGDPPPWRTV